MSASWFPMAVHALSLLSTSQEGFSSAYIASSINTHSVFLRRVLAKLVHNGLLETKEGGGGGYRLTRSPDQITLAEIYTLLEGGSVISASPAEPNKECIVGSGIQPVFQDVINQVDKVVMEKLSQFTISDISKRALITGNYAIPTIEDHL
ncbi:RrF2 family transcriptional regulator [Paenibacillus camerounensis]|uniref:RrF2 family transcriptional regulator n=1 Tax=Paenibacillus camerounensis TaxID=1243663 RepID=UPI0005A80CB8|nr:Rrf2 family transcriptional regulator [Paenibacillus camerounensis]